MNDEPVQREQWVERTLGLDPADGGCITVISGSTLESALAAIGASPDNNNSLPNLPTVRAFVGPSGVVVLVEYHGGYQGSRPEVLARASACGRAAAVQWTIDLASTLALAVKGQVVLDEQALGLAASDVPRKLSRCFGKLDFEERWLGSALVAIDRFLKLPAPVGEDLEERGTFRIDPIPDETYVAPPAPAYRRGDPLAVDDLNHYCREWAGGAITMGEAAVVEFVAAAASVPDRCRQLAAFAANRIAAVENVTLGSLIGPMLAQLNAGQAPTFPREADREIARAINLPYGVESPELGPLMVLKAAAQPDPVRAGLDAFFLTYEWLEYKQRDAGTFVEQASVLLAKA